MLIEDLEAPRTCAALDDDHVKAEIATLTTKISVERRAIENANNKLRAIEKEREAARGRLREQAADLLALYNRSGVYIGGHMRNSLRRAAQKGGAV